MTAIPIERLKRLANEAEPAGPTQPPVPSSTAPSFDLEAFITRHGIQIRRKAAWNGGVKFELETCAFNTDHTGGCAVITQGGNGALGYRCQHNSCSGRGWKELRELFEPKPDITNAATRREHKSPIQLPEIVSATQLFNGGVIGPRVVFEELLWDGLTMFVARPKAGKSWFTLALAVHLAGGPQIPGLIARLNGKVLYIALEEPRGRTQTRLQQLAEMGHWTDNIQFVYALLPLMGGGAEQLRALIRTTGARVVIVDTFTALVKVGGKKDSDVFRGQYSEVTALREIAQEFGVALVVVHHTRKGISDSAIDSIAGTGGLAAGVDCVWLLKRKTDGEATLEVVGREAEEKTFALRFGQSPFGWHVLGDDDARLLNSERREVMDLLREDGPMTPLQIAGELGKSRPSIRMLLKRMVSDGLVSKKGKTYVPHTHC